MKCMMKLIKIILWNRQHRSDDTNTSACNQIVFYKQRRRKQNINSVLILASCCCHGNVSFSILFLLTFPNDLRQKKLIRAWKALRPLAQHAANTSWNESLACFISWMADIVWVELKINLSTRTAVHVSRVESDRRKITTITQRHQNKLRFLTILRMELNAFRWFNKLKSFKWRHERNVAWNSDFSVLQHYNYNAQCGDSFFEEPMFRNLCCFRYIVKLKIGTQRW